MMHAGHDHGAEGEDPSYNPNTNFHVHYQLDIVINGDQQVIPKGVGNNLGANSNKIHTHDFSGLIHVHPGPRTDFVTVGEFFEAWRNDTVLGNTSALFSSTNVLGHTANDTHAVRMYVNGTLNTDFENYEFHDGDKILISYEPIAATNKPSFDPLANQTLLVGAPLWLALDGIDPNGGPLTYSVSVANPNLVEATVPTTNRSMKVEVVDFGVMQFQLFDHLVPEVTNRMVQLVNTGFYNKTATNEIKFHRIAPNFVIQTGDPTGTGGGGSNLGDFNDKFHFDLQHTSSGLLSMAKAGDDTNDSQFFITDTSTRHLDFNHSIWGRLTDGEEIRDAINSVPVGPRDPSLPFHAQNNPNERPLTPVVINSMSIFNDTENGALMLKAIAGATGTTNVTVTVTDQQGNTYSQTFAVTIAADTANSAPFLVNPPANVRGTVGQPISFQLQGTDIEGNPNFFEAIGPGSSSNYVRVPASSGADANGNVTYTPIVGFDSPIASIVTNTVTGQVTVTPKAGFTGTFSMIGGVRGAASTTTSDPFDTQSLQVTVAPTPPSLVDLLPVSDSGSNADNVTNAAGTNNATGSLQFTVSGVTNGAFVKLMKGTTELASGTATGTSITFSTTVLGPLGDGVHAITATQTVGGIESDASAALNVTLDTTAPGAFTSTAPTEADVGVALAYDAQNPGEGTGGFQYQLVTPPAGMTINAATGVVTWIPVANQVGQQTFGISAVDAAGNITTQTVNITVDQPIPPKVVFSLTLTKPDGTPLTSLGANQDFVLNFFVRDVRSVPHGVFAAFTDITWDSTKATVTGPIVFSSDYGGDTSGSTATAGLIDEAGAISGLSELGGAAKKVFSIPMRSSATGNLVFSTNPADLLPDHDILLNQNNGIAILEEEITFGTTSITVNASFNAVADTFNVNEDAPATSLNPIANDTNVGTATNVLTIVAVGPRSNGGNVTIAGDGKTILYTPALNFFGTETFTYTARNQNNEEATGTITVQVQPQNDSPSAVANNFNVEKNSSNTLLDVLANDSIAPDSGETLRVTAVGTGSQGGTITVVNNGSAIRYTPKLNFTGSETFTYTISDRATDGLTSQATVTVNVSSTLPVAAADTTNVTEDAAEAIEINVLANDSLGDGGTALTITAVGTGSKGGTIAITQNGTRISYKPAANAQGTETFTYTINNGLGTATGTVTVNIANTNDPPTAVNDTVSAFKDLANTFDVLANDSPAPDPAENLIISTVTQGAHGTVTITENGKKISYTPTAGYIGADTFTYTVIDPGGLVSASATVTVNVQQFIPSSLAGFVYFDVDNDGVKDSTESPIGNVTITLTGTDTNNAAVNRTVKTNQFGAYKFENLVPGNYTITESQPALTIDGKDTAGSQGGNSATNDKIIITGLAQNTNGVNNNFGERGRQIATMVNGVQVALVSIRDFFSSNSRNYAIAAFDASDNSLWHTTHGPGWQNVTASLVALQNNSSQLKLDITNAQSQELTTTLQVTDDRVSLIAEPGNNALYRLRGGPATLNFVPVPINLGPTAAANSYTATEDTALNVPVTTGLLANDSDPESAALTATLVTQPANGTLSFSTNGSFVYTPAANFNGQDTFAYRANDGTNLSALATVTITVGAVNDAPVAQTNSYTTNEDVALIINATTGVLANDTDPEGTVLTAAVVAQPAHGSLTLNLDGSFTYTPAVNYNGPDSFTYKAGDGTLDSAVTTVNLTVTAVNDSPVATNDSYSTPFETALNIATPGILSNDTDVDSTTLTLTVIAQPEHGDLTLNANGSFVYTPDDDFTGTDGFSYTVGDGTATSTVAAVTIAVEAAGEGEAVDAAMLALMAEDDEDSEPLSDDDGDWQSAIDAALAELTT